MRSKGFRVRLTRQQASKLYAIRDGQRAVYNWTISRLKADAGLTFFDLQNEFTNARQKASHLRNVERAYQNAAIHQARTAADVSNKYGSGNLAFRTQKKRDYAVSCDIMPRFVDNSTVSLPGLGHVRLAEEQSYQFPNNWLYGARSFRLMYVTPDRDAKPAERTYRLYITYKIQNVPKRKTGQTVSIDRGIINPTVVTRFDEGVALNTITYDTTTAFKENAWQNDKTRKRLSKTNKHSRNHRELQAERKRKNRENANRREYAEWLLAKEICRDTRLVILEDLKIAAMTRKGRYKKWLNREMRFVRHSAIVRKVEIVAARKGVKVVRVNPKNTSKLCYKCSSEGEREGERFECERCGRIAHADTNATHNIYKRGTGVTPKVPAGEGMFLERRELGRTRKPPEWVNAGLDGFGRRENTSAQSSRNVKRPKHVGRYPYVISVYRTI